MTDEEYINKFRIILEELEEITHKKHADYGHDSVLKYGMKMRFADIWRKFARLENLIWDEGASIVDKETVRDTLLDLANYAIIAIIVWDNEHAICE